ncbi:hypothetical protein FRACA_2500002 [Frankia canadensis]|uniref:Uncharacterized protein n=1 Tax=Frankia canadensis TaxID=1836972 RepID=A0A2I2KS32_9ACTN|nr:hypothetical protein FRACA_2500002 [Frankia canadensis]SOU55764.1 hypothetical protein FRACA_2500002 [Frankia canadensis]
MVADGTRLLGPDHPDGLTARANLTFLYGQADRTTSRIIPEECVLADQRRLLVDQRRDRLGRN